MKPSIPHMLCGTTVPNLCRIWRQYGGVERDYLGQALSILATVLLLSPFRLYERVRYNFLSARVKLDPSPVFIIGHWEAGHSLTHHLMSCDPQFGYVNLLQSAIPTSFLSLQAFLTSYLPKRLPPTRLADTMPANLEAAQGDDLMLGNLCELSLYHMYIFPKYVEPIFRRTVLFEDVEPKLIERWKSLYLNMLKKIAFATKKQRLLLRSGAHMGRIPHLLSLFPEAKFIHLYRNPYTAYAAQFQRWRGLLSMLALQKYNIDDVMRSQLRFYKLLLEKYFKDKNLIRPENLVEIRFEDLDAHPLETLEQVYKKLDLAGFEVAQKHMEYDIRNRTGTLGGKDIPLTPELIKIVNENWGFAIDRWAYERLPEK